MSKHSVQSTLENEAWCLAHGRQSVVDHYSLVLSPANGYWNLLCAKYSAQQWARDRGMTDIAPHFWSSKAPRTTGGEVALEPGKKRTGTQNKTTSTAGRGGLRRQKAEQALQAVPFPVPPSPMLSPCPWNPMSRWISLRGHTAPLQQRFQHDEIGWLQALPGTP